MQEEAQKQAKKTDNVGYQSLFNELFPVGLKI
jgi:hypothetical protein